MHYSHTQTITRTMISRQSLGQLKDDFLEAHSKYRELKDNNASIGNFFAIDEDDEVWIMQCPKGTDVSVLKNQKIKLPGRSNQDNTETVAVEYPQPVPHAFGHKNRKGQNSIKILPIQGSIILRNRLKALLPPEEFELPSGRVPMPEGIKERHPLHGINYKRKLEINSEITERLKHADEVSTRRRNKKKKSKSKMKEPSSIPVDSEGEVELIAQKKPKKKKRKHSKDDEDVALESPKKSQILNGFTDNVPEDLNWIQKL